MPRNSDQVRCSYWLSVTRKMRLRESTLVLTCAVTCMGAYICRARGPVGRLGRPPKPNLNDGVYGPQNRVGGEIGGLGPNGPLRNRDAIRRKTAPYEYSGALRKMPSVQCNDAKMDRKLEARKER